MGWKAISPCFGKMKIRTNGFYITLAALTAPGPANLDLQDV